MEDNNKFTKIMIKLWAKCAYNVTFFIFRTFVMFIVDFGDFTENTGISPLEQGPFDSLM